MMRLLSFILILLSVPVNTPGRSYWEFKGPLPKAAADNGYYRFSDMTNDLWLSWNNRMIIGHLFDEPGVFPPDEELNDVTPFEFSANFPPPDNHAKYITHEYLFAAGLWVGGVKGNDTLVAQAFDYPAPIPELNPFSKVVNDFAIQAELADREYIFAATDTIIEGDTLFRCQYGDCDDWHPLGIKVTAHSYHWVSPPYNRLAVVTYTIENIDTLPLVRGWAGIYADCDIGNYVNSYLDDVSGYLDGAFDDSGQWVDLDVAYSFDIGGDPQKYGIDEYSTNGVFGVQVLGLSTPGYDVNFNWWANDNNPAFEFAPRQDESPLRDLGGSMAIAYGDSNKYYIMSHPERDYNQIEAGLPHPGWLAGGETGAQAAYGADTRFVISAGPFDLDPGDSTIFTVAYVAGSDCIDNDYVVYWFDPTDPIALADYYELLNLSGLEQAAVAAKQIAVHGLEYPPPGPPDDFALAGYDDTTASFSWSPSYAGDLAGYKLMGRGDGGDWVEYAGVSGSETTATVPGLNPETNYEFAIAAYDNGGAVGMLSAAAKVVTGLPHPPEVLYGNSARGYPSLQWPRTSEPDIASYRLYRKGGTSATPEMVMDASDTSYVDLGATLGDEFRYYVTAVDSIRGESLPSEEITLIPLVLTRGILCLDANSHLINQNILFERSMFAGLAAEAFGDIAYTYREVDDYDSLTVHHLAEYSLVVISIENLAGALDAHLSEVLEQYLGNGGKAILLVRHAAPGIVAGTETRKIRFSPQNIMRKYFHLDSCFVGSFAIAPGGIINGDLKAALPLDSSLNILDWDSTAINRFAYQINGGIPYCGYMWPDDDSLGVYTFGASDTTGEADGQINGIRYLGENYKFYLLNFPLSLMQKESAGALLRIMAQDLDGQYICGDINLDYKFNVGDLVAYIGYLYNDYMPPGLELTGDVDCNGEFELNDLIIMINYYVGKGLAPGCCR